MQKETRSLAANENQTNHQDAAHLQTFSDHQLQALALFKSREERSLSLEVIQIIREVDRRKLFLELGFGSLFDYVTKCLGYEESAANRRISASRLISDIPETAEKIRSGELSLSNLVQAQVFFRKEAKLQKPVSLVEKREVLKLLENKSYREAQKSLLELSPKQSTLRETERFVTPELTEIKFLLNEKCRSKLEKLRLLLSHKNPFYNYAELIEELADMALKKLDRSLVSSADPVAAARSGVDSCADTGSSFCAKRQAASAVKPNNPRSRYISSALKRAIWQRDRGQCNFQNSVTGQKCQSRFQLEFHHIKPFAKGGSTNFQNVTLRCRHHNVHQAIADFGIQKMSGFTVNR